MCLSVVWGGVDVGVTTPVLQAGRGIGLQQGCKAKGGPRLQGEAEAGIQGWLWADARELGPGPHTWSVGAHVGSVTRGGGARGEASGWSSHPTAHLRSSETLTDQNLP